ncbi:MBL fold metallo-hydrolase [Mycolicibacterium moriokaense]|uniref:Alkyl sulfatase n=1 Tax=Mycolicibacterium moriokaense TaxID=39691 RepID=A0AAD1HE61_9MYCO|nr:MBL fold metallo-hydrolase [Mycolicibacterium moriokaense]MCV7039267.1 MBL fold metallo-hydrolase [Mycolicibacterium moriokaense]ORB26888.1 MBL fold metallo-hydrolase [Mycolicibacterium moriokaense]BBX03787.1 alkyl sulfatase [Mycolicibacterium moriokaense]
MSEEPIYRSRPGADALAPATAEHAEKVAPGIWCSPGLSNAYLLTTTDGRVVVNTGMGFESAVHRANFDAVDSSPIRYIIVTQGHYDHVGGLDTMRDPQTQVVAQANWRHWRDDNERLLAYRANNSAFAFSDRLAHGIAAIQQRFGKRIPPQAAPTADIEVDDSLVLTVGGRTLELLATPGGETTDSMVVWLPDERVCLCGNTFGPAFGHIPNFVTMRGDRYRDALTTIASIERVRDLRPEVLITGHFDPIRGADRIHAELTRLRDAIAYLHDRTVEGMNAGKDVFTLMREITLPAELEVGQGYGKASWDVRAIWENYSGWFHHRSTTELYAVGPDELNADFVELAGVDRIVERAEAHLAAERPVHAIHLAEVVVNADPDHAGARAVLKSAHQQLLAASTNFWESAWLTKKIGEYS